MCSAGSQNSHLRFIGNYGKVTAAISNLPKTHGSRKWECTQNAEPAFRKLKKAFTSAPILQHIKQQKLFIQQPYACGFAIAGSVNLYDRFGILRPINLYSQHCSPTEYNYHSYDWEILAIVERIQQLRYYLEGANQKVLIQCDHMNLEYFHTSTVSSQREAWWGEILSS
jgi:hypothetical protein